MEARLISIGHPYSTLPARYVRPQPQRPELIVSEYLNAPIVDLSNSNGNTVIQEIGRACREFGFFQVINHGVEKEVMVKMKGVAREFFELPVEEKMKYYSNDTRRTTRLSTSSNPDKEEILNWRDYLRIHSHPIQDYIQDWPTNPPLFREIVSVYCSKIQLLGVQLQEAISESLGLDRNYISQSLGEQNQHMAINYYPPCPEPELTFGLPAHTDPNTLTILFPDYQVPGLQLLKDGQWRSLKPFPDAFVINLGDQLQALSNSKYKSSWHRAVVNAHQARISIASFVCPVNNAVIKAPEEIINREPAVYRQYTYGEYYDKFWTRNLDQGHCLDLFKIAN